MEGKGKEERGFIVCLHPQPGLRCNKRVRKQRQDTTTTRTSSYMDSGTLMTLSNMKEYARGMDAIEGKTWSSSLGGIYRCWKG